MPPSPKAAAKVEPLPTDGLVHEAVIAQTENGPRAAAKCGKSDKVTRMLSPRAAFVREGRRLDPKAEAAGKVPAGVCPGCWPGNGLVVAAPEKGKGSVRAAASSIEKARKVKLLSES
jgi:hypothetical protein